MVNTVDKSGIRSVLIRRLGAIAGRMACVLAAALLACASSAHAQVIEEGGFPVKGGGVSGEPFSLSCPPRLYVAAGESVLFSCSATAVPEEGVRYAWEPVSGDGLHLLSDAQVLAPLFTAPLSGSAPAYRYRLTAMGGVFRGTATVEVIVEGFSGESLGSPVVREECDPFAVPEGLGEGCAEDKGPLGFVPGPEEGFLFPEAPGLPDRASGPVREGGFDSQTPPRLECPSAVFLEELETGAIECHAWDASGEEYLEYSWEPVGSTTRDYLDNPLLMPEDSPTPSVVAPEAPVYETLESFRSGETTFVYRYRLTATSRATGLSSSSEVEVFVSSSRPSVYCPLEVVVEEGSTVALDCEGVDPLSHRMDYAEDGASILWEWEGLWATSTAPLDATGLSSPLFTAPAGSAGEEYHYIASMTSSSSGFPRTARRRVTVRVVGVEGTQAAAGASALAYKGSAPVITCNDAEAYEATGDFVLDCSVTDEPSGATYAWAARGSTSDTGLLSSATILKPTFSVPSEVGGADKNYYRVTLSASGIDDITEDVTVTVLEKPIISCIDTRLHVPLRSYSTSVYEASPDFELDVCEHGDWQGAPEGSDYTFAWTGAASALALLSDPMIEKPFFDVPVSVQSEETYEYTLTVSAENADAGSLPVRVVVQNAPDIRLICNDANVIEGDNNFRLDCSVTYEPVGATYSWTGTDIANRLSGTTILKPTFSVPDIYPLSKEETVETYEYTVTLEVSGSAVATEDITITVRNGEVLCWVSNDSVLGDLYDPTVDEGASDLPLLTCEAGITSAGGPPYTYSWIATGRINGREAEFLTATDQQNVSFRVPSQVSSDTEYAFYFKVFRASEPENDDEALFRITVANLDPVECHDPPDFVYDRAPPFALNCTYSGDSNGVTWEWDPTDHLTNTDTVTPTFTPPLLNQQQQDFPYTVRARVNGADIGGSEVTVRMLRSPRISVECDGYRFGPPVYQVYEGEDDFVLDCSASIDYGGSAFDYVWTGRNGTVVPGKLSSATVAKPTFNVPEEVTADEPYEYTLTVSAENVESGSVDVTVTVLNKPDIVITCPGDPYRPYERDDDIVLDCSASGAPSGSTYDYVWTGRNGTVVPGRLSSTTIEQPTFDVPNEVGENGETYEYTLAVSADNAVSVTEDVTVTVLNKIEITVTCPGDPYSKYEGEDNFDLDCSATGAPEGTTYEYAWTPRGNTPNTNNLIAGTDGPTPTFEVPENVDAPEHYYYYRLTVSAEGAEDAAASVTVTVRDKPEITVTCPGNPYQPYEGSDDIVLDCSASGGPSGSTYDYVWTERGSTPNTDKLSGTTILKPTFDVPGSVNSDEPYYYTLTASADNAMDGVIDVTVTVKNKPSITVACTGNPYEAYAGDDDIVLDCSASGGPSGSAFDYVWTGRNGTVVPGKLSSTTVAKPTFDVPGSVTGNETYEYTLTVSADNAEDDVANVTVNVLKKVTLTLVCTSPPPVYEGSPDFDLNCSASGAPEGSEYDYVWTGRGSTVVPGRLSSTTVEKPTFDVPEEVDGNETYEYTLTVSARGADTETANVTVRVLNKSLLTLICTPPAPVYEGAPDFDLDCVASGAPVGSTYDYVWTTRGATLNTDKLSGTDGPTPTFDVPEEVDSDETYEYTLTISAENADDASANVTVRVLNTPSLTLVCTPVAPVYEGAEDFDLDCVASGAPSGSDYDYVWTGRGSTVAPGNLSSATVEKPTFNVPPNVDADTDYEYTLTVSADNTESATEDVTVTVLNRKALDVVCATPSPVYEGSADFALDCAATGAPAGSDYAYVWTARGSTANTDLLIAGTDGPTPTFDVPEEVDEDETYEYLLTVSAENAIDATAGVTVKVLKLGSIALICASPPLVYEGSEDFELDCSISGDTGDADYTYEWTARGATSNTAQLSATDISSPTFYVPDVLDETTTYEYLLTVSAENAVDATAEVTVTVLNRGTLAVACAPPPLVYEGSADFALDCTASGAPQGSTYDYVWTTRGATLNTDKLSGTDGPTPTFDVPEEVDSDETYEYTLTISAENADDASANVTVRVLNTPSLTLVCTPVAPVYEGAEDFDLDCVASGAPSGSDYDYVWTGRGSTVAPGNLSSATVEKPTFNVPPNVDADTDYEYTLTVSADNTESATEDVTVTVLNRKALDVVCATPSPVYEGSADFALDCAATGAPAGSEYVYVWTGRGTTTNTDLLISGTDGPTPTFDVPEEVDEDETYEYLLTVSAENAIDATAGVTVKVLKLGSIALICASPPLVYEGSEDFELDCSISGDTGDADYTYEWTARGATSNTAQLSATDISSPTFYVPDVLDETTTYEYLLTVSAENAVDATAEVTVTVLNRGTLAVACAPPPLVYEGSADFALDCTASGAPVGSTYDYVWTTRGATLNTDKLSGTDGPTPTFAVPEALDAPTTYEYLLTVSAENAESGSAEVTVTVLNREMLSVTCPAPLSVYEGSEDFALDCTASGAPAGSDYAYVWTARGSTANTDLLIAGTDGPTPTFSVPDALDETTTYEYLLTVSAENAESGSAEVTVTVLNREMLSVTCPAPLSVYEGSEDFELDCSASGTRSGSDYTYAWTARGSTANTAQLSATDIVSPTFYVPDELDATTTYEYLLTASADNTISGTAEVSVTVLNREMLSVTCPAPLSVYEGSEDFELDCSASGTRSGSDYTYAWTARGSTANTAQLSATDIVSPTFYVPDELDATTTYEYLLTASADNTISGTAEVSVTVLNRAPLSVVCTYPGSIYEGSGDFALDCSASGAPSGSEYDYVWTARGGTANTDQLSAADISSPTFYVPEEVDVTTGHEYLLTASAENAEDGTVEVTVTVLNREMLSVTCEDTAVYEGEGDIMLDCSASGAPSGSGYTYVWMARGGTANTDLLIAGTDGPAPTFSVPDEVDENGETYEYLLTVSADNAEDASAEMTVNVLDNLPLAFVDDSIAGRVYVFTVGEVIADILLPEATGGLFPYTHILTPLLPRGLSLKNAGDSTWTIFGTPLEVSPRTEYTWQIVDANPESVSLAFFIEVVPAPKPPSRPVAEPSEALSLGVTVSVSSLRFGVQSADTEVSLDPMTDGISTRVSGPYHGGRMTLSPGGGEALDENGEMDLSIELASPVVLRREGGIEAASIVLSPSWSLAESCEQLSSQTIGALYTEVTLSDAACRLLLFGGELDLTGVPSGHYAGNMDVVLRSGENEETHSVEVDVTVIPAQQVITIGPRGVRFSTSRELPVGLTEEQNLSIYPHVVFLTEGKSHGVFELSNPSLIPLEVSVSARFGYTEATENGREVVVENTSGSPLGDLSSVVDIHPEVLVLQPGEKGLVRYGVKEGALAAMPERGYAAFFDVVSSPRQYVRSDQMPEEVTGDRTARVTMRVPGVYVPGEGASQLRAALLSISYVGSLSATFLLETQDHPFVGEVLAYDGEGRELGRRETLVYTRSRVRIRLDRVPEGGAVFLRFAPRGSERVPLPASVPWDAPRRDIGAADKDHTRPPQTLVQKP